MLAAMLSATRPQPPPLNLPTATPLPSPSSHLLPTPSRRGGVLRRRRQRPLQPSSPASVSIFEQRMQDSLAVLDLMESQSIPLDPSLLSTLLKSCADARHLHFGRLLHDKARLAGLHVHPFVANNLVLLYSKCGELGLARRLFDEMPERSVVSWTTAISMYQHAGFPHDALDLYRSICSADPGLKPNAFTYTIALNSCASIRNLKLGVEIHEDVLKSGYQHDEFVIVALIDMYAKCGSVQLARQVFDGVEDPSIEACTALIEGYTANGMGKEAMDVVRKVLKSGLMSDLAGRIGLASIIRPCVMEMGLRNAQEVHAHIIKFGFPVGMKTIKALIELYERCDKMMMAYWLFRGLVVKDMGLWARMISGFVRNDMFSEALMLYSDMMSSITGFSPSAVSWTLKACVKILALEEGKQIHGSLIKARHMLTDSEVVDLAELYGSCGQEKEAYKLMEVMKV